MTRLKVGKHTVLGFGRASELGPFDIGAKLNEDGLKALEDGYEVRGSNREERRFLAQRRARR